MISVWRSLLIRWFLVLGLLFGMVSLVGCGLFGPQDVVDFSFTPSSGGNPLLVDFTPTVEGEATDYVWDFGDGSTSSERAPSHVYYTAGKYSVRLTVLHDGVLTTMQKNDCIEVLEVMFDIAVPDLYWLDRWGGAIRRGALTGGTVTTVVANIYGCRSLVVGPGWIYWTQGDIIYAALPNGTSVHPLFYLTGNPQGLALDLVNAKIYWATLPEVGYGPGGIVRAHIAGMNREDWALKWEDADAVPYYVCVDPASGRIYYYRMYHKASGGIIVPLSTSEPKADPVSASIEWSSTGTFSAHSILTNLSRAGGMAIDSGFSQGARYIYWTDTDGGKINRCKTDGTGFGTLASGLDKPKGIAVDIQRGKLYWSDSAGIHRANLDGTSPELIYPGAAADCLTLG